MSDQPPSSVSPDLAAKVLSAEQRNVVKDVAGGGKMPAAIRQELQIAAMTPALAEQQRAAAFLADYCAGKDLTPAQWELIRRVHPGFANSPEPAHLASAASATSDAEGLVLTAEPDRKGKLSMKDAARFALLYKGSEKSWRTIYRWLDVGKAKDDPCPLDAADLMPAWWNRCMTHRCPVEIEQAAVEARKAAAASPPPTSGAGNSDPASPNPPSSDRAQIPTAKTTMPAATTPPVDPSKIIRLEDFDPEEGNRLRELKQLQAAKFKQLRDALERGEDTSVMEGKYVKLCETIDKIESRITERMKKRGLYLLREDVESDMARVSEMMRQFRESMERRVLERCASLNAEQKAEVAAAIRAARSAEDRILAKLNTKTAEDDLLADLRAA